MFPLWPFVLYSLIHLYFLKVVFYLPLHLLSSLQSFTHPSLSLLLPPGQTCCSDLYLSGTAESQVCFKTAQLFSWIMTPCSETLAGAAQQKRLQGPHQGHVHLSMSLSVLHQPMRERQLVCLNTRKRCRSLAVVLSLCNSGDLEGGARAKIYRYNKHGFALSFI